MAMKPGPHPNPLPLTERVLAVLRRVGHSCTAGELVTMWCTNTRAAEMRAALKELLERGAIQRVRVEGPRPGHYKDIDSDEPKAIWRRWEYRIPTR